MCSSEIRHQIFQLLPALQRSVRKLMEPVLAQVGLTPIQHAVLLYIERHNCTNLSALVRETGLGQANASTLCKKLEREGFLLRERSSADERVVTLALTETGRSALQLVEEGFCSYDRQLAQVPAEKLSLFQQGIVCATEILELLTPFDPHPERRNASNA